MELKHLWKSKWTLIMMLLLFVNGVLFWKSDILQSYDKEEYLQDYQEYIDSVVNSADAMSEISIFAEKGSYSAQNIERTKDVFADCGKLNLENTNDTVFEQVLSWKWHYLFILILMFLAVDEFLLERKNGLWEVTYSETIYRKKAGIKRVVALFLTVASVQMLFLGTELILGFFRFGGIGDMTTVVQSSQLCQHFPYLISKWGFLGEYYLLSVAGTFLVVLFCYVLFSLFQERILSYAFIIMLMILEWLCKALIPAQSIWNIVSYINMITYFMPKDYMMYYANWGFGNFIVNRWIVMGVIALAVMLILIFILVWIYEKKRPYSSSSKLEKWVANRVTYFHERIASCSIIGKERYKMYFLRGGIFLILIAGIVSWKNGQIDEVSFSEGERLYLEFCQQHIGVPDEDTLLEVEKLRLEVEKLDGQYSKAISGLEDGSVSSEQFGAFLTIMESSAGKRSELVFLEENLKYLEELEKTQGIKGGLVVQKSYEELFGKSGETRERWTFFCIFFVILLLGYRSYSEDWENLIYSLYRSIANGCKRTYYAKMWIGIENAILVFAVVYGINIVMIVKSFGWGGLSLPVQSIFCLQEQKLSISIGSYFMLFLLLRLLIVLSIYELVKGFSIVLKNSWRCLLVAGMVLMIICVIGPMKCWWLLIPFGMIAELVGRKCWCRR